MKRREKKDLGVIIQDTLTPERHNNGLFASTYKTLSNMRVAFSYMDKSMMKKIIATRIRQEDRHSKIMRSQSVFEGHYKV
ncbi:hypothetical protein E2C01_076015 [Portunus trituberculatus]|uniref:Uncharacterized protein n=1 Tax=Portunus trituberculatus TaxID=210409 RepID=A0A5B7I7M3_PORTR|nr:hypothetical protein [Portunus trituberculatus]